MKRRLGYSLYADAWLNEIIISFPSVMNEQQICFNFSQLLLVKTLLQLGLDIRESMSVWILNFNDNSFHSMHIERENIEKIRNERSSFESSLVTASRRRSSIATTNRSSKQVLSSRIDHRCNGTNDNANWKYVNRKVTRAAEKRKNVGTRPPPLRRSR